MSTNNPYQAPSATVADPVSSTYQPKVFTTKGRIGRLRYLAYTMASYLLIMPAAMLAGVITAFTGGSGEQEGLGIAGMISMILFILSYIAMIVFIFAVAGRRLNDMGHSRWLCLLLIVPFFPLWLIFGSGNADANQYGPPPSANSLGVKIAAFTIPAIMVLGILAAIALPAYQDYVERAQTSQQAE